MAHGPSATSLNTEPTARFWHCGCLVEGEWFIYGGRYKPKNGLAGTARIMYQFDPLTEEWKRIETSGTPPEAVYSVAAASIGHYLYSFGGSDSPNGDMEGRFYNTLHRLDTRTKVWTKLVPQNPNQSPMPRRGAVMIAYGHLLVIFGGYNCAVGEGTLNDVVCYNTKDDCWIHPPIRGVLPPHCMDSSLTRVDHYRAVLFGGYVATGTWIEPDVYILDLQQWSWTRHSRDPSKPWPTSRSAHTSLSLFDPDSRPSKPTLMVILGVNRRHLLDVWIFNLNLLEWRMILLPDNVLPRYLHTSAIIYLPSNRKVIHFGGVDRRKERKSGSPFDAVPMAETEIHYYICRDNLSLEWTLSSCNHPFYRQGDNLLTESDLRILKITLAEHLPKLKEKGLHLNQDDCSLISKEKAVMCLQESGQHELADILNENNGVKRLQDHVFNNIYVKALRDEKHMIRLQVFRKVLCGVPRSGKTTFWKRLALENFKPTQESASTGAAESYILSAHMHTEVLFDLHLYSEDVDLDREALTIYKLIVEAHDPHTSQTEMYTHTTSEKHLDTNDSNTANNLQPIKHSDSLSDSAKHQEEDSTENKIPPAFFTDVSKKSSDSTIREINKRFKELNDLLHKTEDLPDIPNVKKMCHLQDTGGQRAFLELLPTLSMGKALYLIFFNYDNFERSVSETVQIEGSPREVFTGIEYEQIDIIMKSLICVSTASSESSKNVALLVGTHVDKVTPEDVDRVDSIIYEKVKPFLKDHTLVYADSLKETPKENLVLKVAIKENDSCSNEPIFKDVIMSIVDNELKCDESVGLPASWYMFSIILRRLQSAGYPILTYSHCQYIADRLYIHRSALKGLLFRLQKVFGIILYFPEIKGLEDVVICDTSFIYKSISDLIFKSLSFNDRPDVPLSNRLKKLGMFTYKEFRNRCKIKKQGLDVDKLIILLEHLGIIARVQGCIQTAEPEHVNKSECMDHDQEYVIPCVLKDATGQELEVLIEDTQACSIIPLRIYFEEGFAPMGGFCYLFTKLLSSNTGWKLCFSEWENDSIYWRNKVTFEVECDCYNYMVTLLSTDEYYEIHIIHSVSEQPFHLERDGHKICKYVWKAIHTILENSPNKALQTYVTACTCTINHLKTDKHVMKFECKPHKSLPRVKARCAKTHCQVPGIDLQPSVMVWFKKPHILEKGKVGRKVHLCIKNLLFKIKDGRQSPKCEWWVDDERIEADNENYEYRSDKNTFELSILHFDTKLEQTYYKCVVSTAEEPAVSTAVEVIVQSAEVDDSQRSADKYKRLSMTTGGLKKAESKEGSSSDFEGGATAADHQITLQDVAAQAGINTFNIFDQKCSQNILLKLAKHCVNWRLIGQYLKLTKADIAAVNEDNQTADEKRAGMLGRWKEKFAFKATYRVFIEALLDCGRTDDAVDACKIIAKNITITSTSTCGKEQLPRAFKLLLPLADMWEDIGLCLELVDFEDSVKASANNIACSCLRETLKLWLDRVDPPPSLKELAEAVKPFNSDIAAQIIKSL